MRATVCALVAVLLTHTVTAAANAAPEPGCATVIDSTAFTSEAELRQMNATIAGFGLRTTASPAHRRLVDWLEREVQRMPGIKTRSQTSKIRRWLPVTGDLASTGLLFVGHERILLAGAIPYTAPTLSSSGELVYLTDPITAANARGKVVIRDFPAVDRGYLAEAALNKDLIDAGLAGAAGLIIAFDFPREQVRGYYDPHTGTHYRVPGVFVGGAEAQQLKQAVGRRAHLAILAIQNQATTRSVIATLPGQSKEKIVFDANTDGNTWVQENANAALLALAKYFAHQPLHCRPRTIEFVFATGHLHRPAEGTELYARKLDAEYDDGTVAFAFALEHLGTREYVRVGQELQPSGLSEVFGWFAGSPVLSAAAQNAIARHGLDRVFVLPGIDLPVPGRVPPQCSFGGLGTHFHSHLIPSMAMISGPWSLWAPSFGSQAIDFARMRAQTLAAGDTVLALAGVPRAEIAGPYLAYRQARAAGAPTCSHELPPED
ncbi:PA domain-containing protein [Kibdelosporangium aridum]|uniref:PA domain-containing protein n=1 Tax=Kibdelosporangium aridum TaxID=2030 RepID=UPI000566197B|nr:PA domain-containing protein [Kibdelosporangium aridum]